MNRSFRRRSRIRLDASWIPAGRAAPRCPSTRSGAWCGSLVPPAAPECRIRLLERPPTKSRANDPPSVRRVQPGVAVRPAGAPPGRGRVWQRSTRLPGARPVRPERARPPAARLPPGPLRSGHDAGLRAVGERRTDSARTDPLGARRSDVRTARGRCACRAHRVRSRRATPRARHASGRQPRPSRAPRERPHARAARNARLMGSGP